MISSNIYYVVHYKKSYMVRENVESGIGSGGGSTDIKEMPDNRGDVESGIGSGGGSTDN
jgi:hypothetical protein